MPGSPSFVPALGRLVPLTPHHSQDQETCARDLMLFCAFWRVPVDRSCPFANLRPDVVRKGAAPTFEASTWARRSLNVERRAIAVVERYLRECDRHLRGVHSPA